MEYQNDKEKKNVVSQLWQVLNLNKICSYCGTEAKADCCEVRKVEVLTTKQRQLADNRRGMPPIELFLN
jgi:hypothetical protein